MRLNLLPAPLFLLSLLPTSALAQNTAQGVFDSITAIDIAVRNLTAVLTPYSGGIYETEPFIAAGLNVHAVNREGFRRASASPQFTSDESRRIVDNVENTVAVSIPEGIEVLKTKKAFFDQAEVTSVVRSFVSLLRNDHDTFSLAVGGKLSPDQVLRGGAAAGKIDLVLRGAELFLLAP